MMYLFICLSLGCLIIGLGVNEEPQTSTAYVMAALYSIAAVFELRIQMILKRRIGK